MSAGTGHGTGHGTTPAEEYVPVFAGAARARLEQLFTKYPTKQACLLPALWIVQEARGWISEQAIGEVDDELELSLG